MLLAASAAMIALSASFPDDPHEMMLRGEGRLIATLSSADTTGAWRIDFRRQADPARPEGSDRFHPLFLARMIREPGADVPSGGEVWADSRTCPRLVGVIAAVNDLAVPRFDLGPAYGVAPPGAEIPPLRIPPADGRRFRLDGQARQPDGAMAQLSVADSDGPVSRFGQFVLQQLEDCWSSERPSSAS